MDKFLMTTMEHTLFNDKYVDLQTLHNLGMSCITSELPLHKYLKYTIAIKSKTTRYHYMNNHTILYKQLTGVWPTHELILQGASLWK